MADRPWWLIALQWTAWLVAMTLVASWFAKARKAAARSGSTLVLVHPPATLILGIVCTLMFGALAVASANYVTDVQWWVPWVFIAFVLMGAATLGEALWVRHELRDTGIGYRGLWRRYDHVYWNEIASAGWSPAMKWLVVTTNDGRVMRFSGLLNGLESLATALAERVPRLDVDEETAVMLADAREGRLPNLF
jgi:hypothetical protein